MLLSAPKPFGQAGQGNFIMRWQNTASGKVSIDAPGEIADMVAFKWLTL